MTEQLVPYPDAVQTGIWKYLEDVNRPAVYGCAKQVYGGALLDGGFDDQAGAAAACGTGACTPTSLAVPDVEITSIPTIYYRINDESVAAWEGLAPAASGDVLGELLVGLSLSTTGGDSAAFMYRPLGFYGPEGMVIGAGDGEHHTPTLTGYPITLHLLTHADSGLGGSPPDYDFVAEVFGESVSAHSCGVANWFGF